MIGKLAQKYISCQINKIRAFEGLPGVDSGVRRTMFFRPDGAERFLKNRFPGLTPWANLFPPSGRVWANPNSCAIPP
jgi:hypothetical protein